MESGGLPGVDLHKVDGARHDARLFLGAGVVEQMDDLPPGGVGEVEVEGAGDEDKHQHQQLQLRQLK